MKGGIPVFLHLQAFERPGDLIEALAFLARTGARALAGGTAAVGPVDAETVLLVDLSGLGLRYIRPEQEAVVLGAMTTLDDVLRSPELLLAGGGVLAEAVELTGPPSLLNRATIGGALAHPERAPELIAALLALGAGVSVVRKDTSGADVLWQDWPLDAFLAAHATALKGGLIGALRIPTTPMLTGMERVARTPRDLPAVSVVAALHMANGVMTGVRVATAGAGPLPVRLTAAEKVLEGARPVSPLLDQAAEAARITVEPPADLRGSAEYRRHLVGVLTHRALTSAIWPHGRM
jgi:aerobic carbon-monoxide dehydrogenase medium subunit